MDEIPHSKLATFCRRHHIKQLSFFGSVLRDDFRPDSDVDVLVEFETGHTPGWDIVSMEDELSSMLSRKVDLHTRNDLSRYIRDRVMRQAKVLYAAE
jgi:predicted nucleotidyltransferase